MDSMDKIKRQFDDIITIKVIQLPFKINLQKTARQLSEFSFRYDHLARFFTSSARFFTSPAILFTSLC